MKKWYGFLVMMAIVFSHALCFADSLNLFNDSPFTLTAEVYSYDGKMLGQFVLNPRDATQWSDQFENMWTENASASQAPYSVYWYCQGGGIFGTCSEVATGSLVSAQSCGGPQQCPQANQPNQ